MAMLSAAWCRACAATGTLAWQYVWWVILLYGQKLQACLVPAAVRPPSLYSKEISIDLARMLSCTSTRHMVSCDRLPASGPCICSAMACTRVCAIPTAAAAACALHTSCKEGAC